MVTTDAIFFFFPPIYLSKYLLRLSSPSICLHQKYLISVTANTSKMFCNKFHHSPDNYSNNSALSGGTLSDPSLDRVKIWILKPIVKGIICIQCVCIKRIMDQKKKITSSFQGLLSLSYQHSDYIVAVHLT